MGKKTLILHIGQSKTGTSSIQKFCQINRDKLAEAGIIYPSVKKSGLDINLLEHNAFAESLCGINRYPNLTFEEYIAQFKGDKILLSAESFFGVPHIWSLGSANEFLPAHRAKLEKLRAWTNGYQLEIILYLRHPLDWYRSAVSHIIRHEGLLVQKIYETDAQLYEFLKPHMDYVSIIRLWQEVLSPSVFTIKAFDCKTLVEQDSVADFCSLIGYKGTHSSELEENSSWPAEFTVLKKQLNQKSRSKWRELFIIDVLNQLANQYKHLSTYDISEDLQARILEDMSDMCKQLSSQYHVEFTVKDIKTPRDIDQAVLACIAEQFDKICNSPKGQLKLLSVWGKANMRQHFGCIYNFVKKVVR